MSNYYYSGQGSLYAGDRESTTGKPKGLDALGNVPELSIDIETQEFSHRESESGNRLEDLVITQQKSGSFTFKMENVSMDNLAMALWGEKTVVAGSSVTNEVVYLTKGKRTPVAFPSISTVTVSAKDGDDASLWAATTAYTLGQYRKPTVSNNHYYKATVAGTSGGSEPTWPTNGGTVTDGGVTWTDMGLITKSSSTDYSLDLPNGVVVALSTGTIEDGRPYNVDYTYAASTKLDAFTKVAAPEKFLRFEGLNTVDGSRVIVEIMRAKFNPLTGYALINEELSQPEVKGNILADSLASSGSKYFRQFNVAAS